MKISLHLADAAQTDQFGKVSALGLGWSYIGSPLPAHAIVAFFEVDPGETDRDHPFTIELVDEDGAPAQVLGGQPAFHADGAIRIGSDPASLPGAPQAQAYAFPVPGGIPLQPGKRWEYRFTTGGAIGSVPFATRPS